MNTTDTTTTPADSFKYVSAADRAALLADIAEAIRTRDAQGLAVALGMAPFSSRAYADRLEALADATDPDELNDPERLRAEQVQALKASATPGALLDDELAGAILDALNTWHAITTETPAQKATREAFAEARRLVDLYGDDDPRAFAAIIKAVELQDPGCCKRMAAECGIHLPTPTHCNAEGAPLYSLEEVAQALDADPDDLHEHVARLEEAGFDVRRQPAGRMQ